MKERQWKRKWGKVNTEMKRRYKVKIWWWETTWCCHLLPHPADVVGTILTSMQWTKRKVALLWVLVTSFFACSPSCCTVLSPWRSALRWLCSTSICCWKMLTSLAGHEGRSQDVNGFIAEDKEMPQHWIIKTPKHQDDQTKDCNQEYNQKSPHLTTTGTKAWTHIFVVIRQYRK